MVASIQNGTLRVQFNRVGGCENFSRTETETEDAGSPFSHHRPGHFIGGAEPISKFASMAVAIIPEKEPVIRARKPLDVSARALKF